MKQLSLILLFLVTTISFSQIQNQSQLTIDEIMKGEDFVGYLPTNIKWSDNSEDIYFSWNPNNDTIRSTYAVNINSKIINKLTFNDLKSQTNSGDYTTDYKQKVYEKEGDLFLMNTSTYNSKRITNTNARESNPQFSEDQKFIIYQQDNNVYKWSMADGTTEQLTNFKSGNKTPESKLNA